MVLEHVNNKVILLTLSILSIISLFLSLLMFFNTETGFRQEISILLIFMISTQIVISLGAILYVGIKQGVVSSPQRRHEETGECLSQKAESANQLELVDKWQKPTALTFHSITKKYVSPSAPIVLCPHCSFLIDFNQRVEWLGPSALKCGSCKKAVEIADLFPDD